MSFFLLDTVNIPASTELTPIQNLVTHILLFFRNATLENRVNKVHFTKNQEFLPCLLSFLSAHNQHPKIKAYTASVLWCLVHGHQGIKAAINKQNVLSELHLMRSEYQRICDKNGWIDTEQAEFHATYSLSSVPKTEKALAVMTEDWNGFVLKALNGIIVLCQ